MNGLLQSILRHGSHAVFQGLPGQAALVRSVQAWTLDAVQEIVGEQARADLARRGLGHLHEHLPVDHIGALRDRVMPRLRGELLDFAWRLGRDVLGLTEEFFVDDYLILRVNFPYEVAVRGSERSENPGIGRASPDVAQRPGSLKRRDPAYNPKAYHAGTPPASWAHGPHKDTWTGHSRDGVNLWWAITEVLETNSMVFYPDTFHVAYEVDPSSLYARSGQRIGKPVKMALRSGELLVFNPELLHATHLNTSCQTRLAMSARINAAAPVFDPGCFYAREFWHSSSALALGDHGSVIQFHRDAHLKPAPPDPLATCAAQTLALEVTAHPAGDGHVVLARSALGEGDRWTVCLPGGERIALWRCEDRWHATASVCPHLPIALADGHLADDHVFCPAHAVAFDLSSGKSECASLALRVYALVVDAERVTINLNA